MRCFLLFVSVLLLFAACSPQHGNALLLKISNDGHYDAGEELNATVSSYTSRLALLKYSYYVLPLCRPAVSKKWSREYKNNFGGKMLGSHLQPSNFRFRFLEEMRDVTACRATLGKSTIRTLRRMIGLRYTGHMYLDGLPAVNGEQNSTVNTAIGYPLGDWRPMVSSNVSFNNHFDFTIGYTKISDAPKQPYRITSFTVATRSVRYDATCRDTTDANLCSPLYLPDGAADSFDVNLTYSVRWREQSLDDFYTREAVYVNKMAVKKQTRGHLTTALNAVLVVIIFGLWAGWVLVRTVHKDLARTMSLEEGGPLIDSGWRLVSGDVFRAPRHALLLTALVGSGFQVFMMVIVVQAAYMLHLLRRSRQGSLLEGFIMSYFLCGGFGGWVVAQMLKFLQRQSWQNGLLATHLLPFGVVSWYLILNFVQLLNGTSATASFWTLFVLAVGMAFVNLPLALLGLWVGFRKHLTRETVKVSSVPRLIPATEAHWVPLWVLLGGLLPFAVFFSEINIIFGSLWQDMPLYFFGATTCLGIVLAILCAEVSIIITYVTLNWEDYNWWWRSFCTLATSGIFVFLYSIIYLTTSLKYRSFSSVVLYVGYSAGIALLCSLTTGTLGFLASAIFVRYIYSFVKVD